MSSVVEKLPDGTVRINEVVVFSCGCGDVVPQARNMLRMAGVPDVAIVTTSLNRKVKDYIKSIGLNVRVPSLNKGRHSVLYNPFTGQFIDLLNSPQTEIVSQNIFKVVRGY